MAPSKAASSYQTVIKKADACHQAWSKLCDDAKPDHPALEHQTNFEEFIAGLKKLQPNGHDLISVCHTLDDLMSLANTGFMTDLFSTLELPASELCMALQAYLWTDLISLAYQAHSSSDSEEAEQGHGLRSALASLSLRLNDAAMKQVLLHRKAAKNDKVASEAWQACSGIIDVAFNLLASSDTDLVDFIGDGPAGDLVEAVYCFADDPSNGRGVLQKKLDIEALGLIWHRSKTLSRSMASLAIAWAARPTEDTQRARTAYFAQFFKAFASNEDGNDESAHGQSNDLPARKALAEQWSQQMSAVKRADLETTSSKVAREAGRLDLAKPQILSASTVEYKVSLNWTCLKASPAEKLHEMVVDNSELEIHTRGNAAERIEPLDIKVEFSNLESTAFGTPDSEALEQEGSLICCIRTLESLQAEINEEEKMMIGDRLKACMPAEDANRLEAALSYRKVLSEPRAKKVTMETFPALLDEHISDKPPGYPTINPRASLSTEIIATDRHGAAVDDRIFATQVMMRNLTSPSSSYVASPMSGVGQLADGMDDLSTPEELEDEPMNPVDQPQDESNKEGSNAEDSAAEMTSAQTSKGKGKRKAQVSKKVTEKSRSARKGSAKKSNPTQTKRQRTTRSREPSQPQDSEEDGSQMEEDRPQSPVAKLTSGRKVAAKAGKSATTSKQSQRTPASARTPAVVRDVFSDEFAFGFEEEYQDDHSMAASKPGDHASAARSPNGQDQATSEGRRPRKDAIAPWMARSTQASIRQRQESAAAVSRELLEQYDEDETGTGSSSHLARKAVNLRGKKESRRQSSAKANARRHLDDNHEEMLPEDDGIDFAMDNPTEQEREYVSKKTHSRDMPPPPSQNVRKRSTERQTQIHDDGDSSDLTEESSDTVNALPAAGATRSSEETSTHSKTALRVEPASTRAKNDSGISTHRPKPRPAMTDKTPTKGLAARRRTVLDESDGDESGDVLPPGEKQAHTSSRSKGKARDSGVHLGQGTEDSRMMPFRAPPIIVAMASSEVRQEESSEHWQQSYPIPTQNPAKRKSPAKGSAHATEGELQKAGEEGGKVAKAARDRRVAEQDANSAVKHRPNAESQQEEARYEDEDEAPAQPPGASRSARSSKTPTAATRADLQDASSEDQARQQRAQAARQRDERLAAEKVVELENSRVRRQEEGRMEAAQVSKETSNDISGRESEDRASTEAPVAQQKRARASTETEKAAAQAEGPSKRRRGNENGSHASRASSAHGGHANDRGESEHTTQLRAQKDALFRLGSQLEELFPTDAERAIDEDLEDEGFKARRMLKAVYQSVNAALDLSLAGQQDLEEDLPLYERSRGTVSLQKSADTVQEVHRFLAKLIEKREQESKRRRQEAERQIIVDRLAQLRDRQEVLISEAQQVMLGLDGLEEFINRHECRKVKE